MPDYNSQRSGVTYEDFNNSQSSDPDLRVSNRRNQIAENRRQPTHNEEFRAGDFSSSAQRVGTANRFGDRGQRPEDASGAPSPQAQSRSADRPQPHQPQAGGGNRPGGSGSGSSRGQATSGGGNGNGGSGAKAKKKHPVLKFFGILLILAVVAGAGFVISQNMKGTDEWQREYVGTWQVAAIGNASHPIMSLGTSLVLGNAADISSNMKLGVADNLESQITTFGIHKEYAFSFDKGHCKLTALDGIGSMEGDLVFGKLVVKDATGTITVYDKTSQMYKMNYDQSQPDARALMDIASKAAAGAGDAGQFVLEQLQNVDQGQLEEYLSQADTQQLQEMLGQMDASTMQDILNGTGNVAQLLDGQGQPVEAAPES